jgi:hypothetical protein
VNYATAIKAHLKIAKLGEVIEEPIVSRDTGKILGYRTKPNPWLAIRDRAHRLMHSSGAVVSVVVRMARCYL